MTIPVGKCLSWTAEEVLLIFWPPGPEPLRKVSVREDSGRVGLGGRMMGFLEGWEVVWNGRERIKRMGRGLGGRRRWWMGGRWRVLVMSIER